MPELPEVETTLRGIQPYLDGAIIKELVVRNSSLRWPVPVKQLQVLLGQTVQSVERRAKYLLIHTNEGTMLLHLGMSGSLRILDSSIALRKHDHIDLVLSGSKILRFNDPRRFGCCLFVAPGSNHDLLVSLGPEPLSKEFDGDYLFRRSRKRSLAIKNFIMDGKVVVGVGNIYASESLFDAGIRPSMQAKKVSKARHAKLALAIKAVLQKAIKAGGTTLNDFLQVDGNPGYFKQELKVYARDGEPCYTCGSQIESLVIGQRNTFYCPACQSF